MHWLQRSGQKAARRWRPKERARKVFAAGAYATTASALLSRWISRARCCRRAPFKRLGAAITKHHAGIVEHFRSGLDDGFAEAINGRFQAAKGYSTGALLITVRYRVCAKLKHLPKSPWLQALNRSARENQPRK
jgi:transposase